MKTIHKSLLCLVVCILLLVLALWQLNLNHLANFALASLSSFGCALAFGVLLNISVFEANDPVCRMKSDLQLRYELEKRRIQEGGTPDESPKRDDESSGEFLARLFAASDKGRR